VTETPPLLKDYIPLPRVAEALGLSRSSAWQAVKRGDIRAVQVGRQWFVPISDLDQALAFASLRSTTPQRTFDICVADATAMATLLRSARKRQEGPATVESANQVPHQAAPRKKGGA
jgi:excisionase family DNA binding protein